jgi:hypothetical protein
MAKSIEAVAADLVRETASWDSIDIRVTTEQHLLIPIGKNEPKTSHADEQFIETFVGQKYYKKTDGEPGHQHIVFLGYSESKQSASVIFKGSSHDGLQNSITLTKTFMDEQLTGHVMRPEPLRFLYVGLIPLREAVLKAERIGSDRVADRACELFLFKAVPGGSVTQDLLYHLDGATSMPLKVEAFANQSRFQAAKPSWIWEAMTLDNVQGYHISVKSRYTGFIVSEDAASTAQLVNDYSVESIRFNDKYPASTFWPKMDKGVFINDLIVGKSYYNTPDKKAPHEVGIDAVSASADPIVAGEPSDATPWASAAGVALGASLLLLGAYLWLKRT